MEEIRMFQVDAFAEGPFTGNPAAVCLMDSWPEDDLMQAIAAENNLAETAFLVKNQEDFGIRWFTPAVEVDLCGHATLASGYVILEVLGEKEEEVVFHSKYSGVLKVFKKDGKYWLDFPVDVLVSCDLKDEVAKAVGIMPLELLRGKGDLVAVYGSEENIASMKPDLKRVSELDARGLIVTAPGKEADFVSRFFGPQVGIDEDPVTGSAHTSLTPLWAGKTGKTHFIARQLSRRGGRLECELKDDRCLIGGDAKLFFAGKIYI